MIALCVVMVLGQPVEDPLTILGSPNEMLFRIIYSITCPSQSHEDSVDQTLGCPPKSSRKSPSGHHTPRTDETTIPRANKLIADRNYNLRGTRANTNRLPQDHQLLDLARYPLTLNLGVHLVQIHAVRQVFTIVVVRVPR
jgi:hypothetical protein